MLGTGCGQTEFCSDGWGLAQYIFNPIISWCGAVFPPCALAWGKTMVGIMAVMVTSFKGLMPAPVAPRTVEVSAPNPAACQCWTMPSPETPGHSQASLAQSLVGSLLLYPGSWCAQDFVPSKSLFPQSCGCSVVKSHWPSNSLGVHSPFARSPGWEICCGPQNFCNTARISLVLLFSSLWVLCFVALWWG